MDEAQKQEAVDAAKLKNGGKDVYSLDTVVGFFVHRRVNRDERRIYRGLREDGKTLDAQDCLMSTVIFPDKAELAKVLDDYPFVIEILENAIIAASGIDLEAKRKKH